MHVEVRNAVRDDVQYLVDFNAMMALETEGKELSRELLTPGVEAVLADPQKGFYVIAEADGEIVGGLMVTFEWSDWRNRWFWWIQSVFVVPSARGSGVYRLMYENVKRRADESGDVCGFRLYVEKDNTRAQTVYKRLGMNRPDYLMYEEMVPAKNEG